MSCDHCNGTGMVYENREGTKHPYTCKKCKHYDPSVNRFRLGKQKTNIPTMHFE